MNLPAAFVEGAVERIVVGDVEVPSHFGDPQAEYEAARSGVALTHRLGRSLVRVGGDDRAKFLQGLISNDVVGLAAGAGCCALFLDNKGHVRGVLDVWATDDALLIGCESRFIDDGLPDLSRYVLAADVQIEDLRPRRAAFALLGAAVDDALTSAGAEPPPDEPYAHRATTVGGRQVRLARTPDLGATGLEVQVDAEAAEETWDAIVEALAGAPVRAGVQAVEALRVEHGVLRLGREITGEEFPQELRLDDAVDYEKGCYLGQETVARIHYRGQVNRLLTGLRAEAPLPADAELISSGREVGRLTSAATSPRLGAVALGIVRRDEVESEATLQVRVDDEIVGEARVVGLPIDG